MIQCGQNLSPNQDGHLHPWGWDVAVVSKEPMIPPASWSPCRWEWEAPEAYGHAQWRLNSLCAESGSLAPHKCPIQLSGPCEPPRRL